MSTAVIAGEPRGNLTENSVLLPPRPQIGAIKNRSLWFAILRRFASVNDLCDSHQVLSGKEHVINQLLECTLHPRKYATRQCTYHEYRSICYTLENILGLASEELFPEHIYQHLLGEALVMEITFTDCRAFGITSFKRRPRH